MIFLTFDYGIFDDSFDARLGGLREMYTNGLYILLILILVRILIVIFRLEFWL